MFMVRRMIRRKKTIAQKIFEETSKIVAGYLKPIHKIKGSFGRTHQLVLENIYIMEKIVEDEPPIQDIIDHVYNENMERTGTANMKEITLTVSKKINILVKEKLVEPYEHAEFDLGGTENETTTQTRKTKGYKYRPTPYGKQVFEDVMFYLWLDYDTENEQIAELANLVKACLGFRVGTTPYVIATDIIHMGFYEDTEKQQITNYASELLKIAYNQYGDNSSRHVYRMVSPNGYVLYGLTYRGQKIWIYWLSKTVEELSIMDTEENKPLMTFKQKLSEALTGKISINDYTMLAGIRSFMELGTEGYVATLEDVYWEVAEKVMDNLEKEGITIKNKDIDELEKIIEKHTTRRIRPQQNNPQTTTKTITGTKTNQPETRTNTVYNWMKKVGEEIENNSTRNTGRKQGYILKPKRYTPLAPTLTKLKDYLKDVREVIREIVSAQKINEALTDTYTVNNKDEENTVNINNPFNPFGNTSTGVAQTYQSPTISLFGVERTYPRPMSSSKLIDTMKQIDSFYALNNLTQSRKQRIWGKVKSIRKTSKNKKKNKQQEENKQEKTASLIPFTSKTAIGKQHQPEETTTTKNNYVDTEEGLGDSENQHTEEPEHTEPIPTQKTNNKHKQRRKTTTTTTKAFNEILAKTITTINKELSRIIQEYYLLLTVLKEFMYLAIKKTSEKITH